MSLLETLRWKTDVTHNWILEPLISEDMKSKKALSKILLDHDICPTSDALIVCNDKMQLKSCLAWLAFSLVTECEIKMWNGNLDSIVSLSDKQIEAESRGEFFTSKWMERGGFRMSQAEQADKMLSMQPEHVQKAARAKAAYDREKRADEDKKRRQYHEMMDQLETFVKEENCWVQSEWELSDDEIIGRVDRKQ